MSRDTAVSQYSGHLGTSFTYKFALKPQTQSEIMLLALSPDHLLPNECHLHHYHVWCLSFCCAQTVEVYLDHHSGTEGEVKHRWWGSRHTSVRPQWIILSEATLWDLFVGASWVPPERDLVGKRPVCDKSRRAKMEGRGWWWFRQEPVWYDDFVSESHNYLKFWLILRLTFPQAIYSWIARDVNMWKFFYHFSMWKNGHPARDSRWFSPARADICALPPSDCVEPPPPPKGYVPLDAQIHFKHQNHHMSPKSYPPCPQALEKDHDTKAQENREKML